jgi:hypothetical protein
MPAPTLATMPAFEVVFFRKNHQATLVEVVVFSFNERLFGGFGGLGVHLK